VNLARSAMVAVAAAGLLGGCGSSQFDRVSTGAGTGAGTGAVIGLIGGPIGVGLGAAIGAGVGALTGGVTRQEQLDLGKPVWK
jgi:osmotically inducible lipoprotein OsmB